MHVADKTIDTSKSCCQSRAEIQALIQGQRDINIFMFCLNNFFEII